MSLLLLPGLSPPVQRAEWWTAYRNAIQHVLKLVKPTSEHLIARLDIAISLRSASTSTTNRTAFFPYFQDVLREVYSLVCVCAAQNKIELDFPGGIDVRVYFLDNMPASSGAASIGRQHFSGPMIDLHAFVGAKRPYQTIYSIDSGPGEEVLSEISGLWHEKSSFPKVQKFSGHLSPATSGAGSNTVAENDARRIHRSVAVGGTFDHLHIGHKLLLAATVYLPQPATSDSPWVRRITIGITGDELLVNKKHGALVESWEERQQRTAEFIDSILVFHPDIFSVRKIQETDQPGPNGKVVKVTYGDEVEINYTRISDPFGPTITEEAISALIISAETRAGGKAVNDKRVEKGWKPLEVFEVDVLDTDTKEDGQRTTTDDQNFASKISSTEIRRRLEAKERVSGGRL